jgi:hypothetical protein
LIFAATKGFLDKFSVGDIERFKSVVEALVRNGWFNSARVNTYSRDAFFADLNTFI